MALVIDIATAKNAKYPLTKKWFLTKFPEYKEKETAVIAEEEKEAKKAELEAKLEALNHDIDDEEDIA
jgi:hypothetical protein